MAISVTVLRELFRNLQEWDSLYQSEGIDTITGDDGQSYSLWDLKYLYGHLGKLPKRQHQAIELYLVQNMREADAAVVMGVSATNPIGIYATVGLKKLIGMIEAGELPKFKADNGTDSLRYA